MTIGDRIRSGRKFRIDEPIVCCMAYERGSYLKKLPLLIPELIGYHVLPAIAALGGDGIPKNQVARFLHEAKISAGRLLSDCEDTRLLLKTGIAHEYKAMRRGESHLLDLLERTHALATPQIPEEFSNEILE